jgi:hypothetical protein
VRYLRKFLHDIKAKPLSNKVAQTPSVMIFKKLAEVVE